MGKVKEMKVEFEMLLNSIKSKNNPILIADDISHFIITHFKSGKMNLYEAYMVNMEVIRFKRLGYTQTAWNERVRITTCLTLLNQKLLAHVFNENLIAEKVKKWALEAYGLNKEKRPHYIMDRYHAFLEANNNTQLLEELLEIRHKYDKLSDADGPYHNETFPYHFYSSEEILLNTDEKEKYSNNKRIDGYIENLIINLNFK